MGVDPSGNAFNLAVAAISGLFGAVSSVIGDYMDSYIYGTEFDRKEALINASVAFGVGFVDGFSGRSLLKSVVKVLNVGYTFVSSAYYGDSIDTALYKATVVAVSPASSRAVSNKLIDKTASAITKAYVESRTEGLLDLISCIPRLILGNHRSTNSSSHIHSTNRIANIHALGA